jgi:membrane protein implicated in regulation of membrane protease activity
VQHWIGWTIVAIVCVVAEIFTEGFFIMWFGIGAAASAVAAFLGASVPWQFVFFIGVSAALVVSTKKLTSPVFKRAELKTNVNALPGTMALVTQPIPEQGSGQVKVNGEIWTARSNDGRRIPAGVTVKILRVAGVHVVVESPE